MGWRVACAGWSPISGVDTMTGADVAGDLGTGVGEATPLHAQRNIADNKQIPENRHRILRTVAFLVVVFKGVCLLKRVPSALHESFM